MRNYKQVYPKYDQVGLLEILLEQEVVDNLWKYIETAKENPKTKNHDLAGNITSSLVLKDQDNWFFDVVLLEAISIYNQTYPLWQEDHAVLTLEKPYVLDSLWVNFQKQNEFNPIHKHSGVYSFEIWMQIPYTEEEQKNIPFVKHSNAKYAGEFHYFFTDMFGRVRSSYHKSDHNSEGTMLIFPSELNHCVYPFYGTDKERITISGNIKYDGKAMNPFLYK